MSSGFSVADRIHLAVNSCLPCLTRVPSNDSLTNPHSSSQLRGLLINPDSDTLSLHSNPGRTHRRHRKHKKSSNSTRSSQRHITLFGYNLFGRPAPPPIQLPDTDDDALYSATGPLESALTTQSSATFDSDAAPLDAHTISGLSGPAAAAALAEAKEEEQRQREERRKKRKERKEMKKLARALAVPGEGEFEGFQGSGDGYFGIPSPFLPEDGAYGSDQHRQRPPSPNSLLPHIAMTEEGDDEEADLDGVVYTRRRRPNNSSSNSGSDSRSRTSNSISDRYSAVGSPYPRQPPMTAGMAVHKSSSSSTSPKKKRAKSKSTSSHTPSSAYYTRTKSMSSSSNSNSNYTNTDNTSLATPTSPHQSFLPHGVENESHNASVVTIISPSTIEQGQGLFDLEDEDLPEAQVRVMPHSSIKSHHQSLVAAPPPGFVVVGAERASMFPSTGLGRSGTKSTAGKMRGAFLADTSA